MAPPEPLGVDFKLPNYPPSLKNIDFHPKIVLKAFWGSFGLLFRALGGLLGALRLLFRALGGHLEALWGLQIDQKELTHGDPFRLRTLLGLFCLLWGERAGTYMCCYE